MALTPSAKKKLAVLGIALTALAVDRGLIFSGGSDANAQVSDAAAQQQNAATPEKQAPSAPKVQVAGVLESLRQQIELESPERDAFRLPEQLQPPADEQAPIPQPMVAEESGEAVGAPVRAALPTFEVTSIIAASTGNPMAVINGTPIRIGQTREGITLVSVSARSATIRYAGQTVEVRLNDNR